jgi:hypothetical protein
MTMIALDTVLCRSPKLMASGVGEETMMMDIDKGMYYALNSVSSRIWSLLEQPLSMQAVCDKLLDEYDVEPEVCKQEVEQFLGQLLERNIVTVVHHKTDAPSEA